MQSSLDPWQLMCNQGCVIMNGVESDINLWPEYISSDFSHIQKVYKVQ